MKSTRGSSALFGGDGKKDEPEEGREEGGTVVTGAVVTGGSAGLGSVSVVRGGGGGMSRSGPVHGCVVGALAAEIVVVALGSVCSEGLAVVAPGLVSCVNTQ